MPKCLDPKPGAPLIQEGFNQSKSCWLWGPTGRGSSSPTRTLTQHESPSPDKVRSRASVGAASQPESGPMRRRGQPTEGAGGGRAAGALTEGAVSWFRSGPAPPSPAGVYPAAAPSRTWLHRAARGGGSGSRLVQAVRLPCLSLNTSVLFLRTQTAGSRGAFSRRVRTRVYLPNDLGRKLRVPFSHPQKLYPTLKGVSQEILASALLGS